MKHCKFATNAAKGWVECGQPAVTNLTLGEQYDKDMCQKHSELFSTDDGWVKTPITK